MNCVFLLYPDLSYRFQDLVPTDPSSEAGAGTEEEGDDTLDLTQSLDEDTENREDNGENAVACQYLFLHNYLDFKRIFKCSGTFYVPFNYNCSFLLLKFKYTLSVLAGIDVCSDVWLYRCSGEERWRM